MKQSEVVSKYRNNFNQSDSFMSGYVTSIHIATVFLLKDN